MHNGNAVENQSLKRTINEHSNNNHHHNHHQRKQLLFNKNDNSNNHNEIDCTEPDMFQCRDGQCVPSAARCNFAKQCNDGSDEMDCQSMLL